MSSKTTNYNLHKIDLTDSPPDITVLNPNFDKIDAELKIQKDTLTTHLDDLAQAATLTMSAATQSIANDTTVTVKFDELENVNAPWITLNTDGTFKLKKGKYVIDASVRFAGVANAVGYRQVAGGNFANRAAPVAQGETIVSLSRFVDIKVDDTPTGVAARHTQGTSLDILKFNTNVVVRKVG